MSSRELLDLYLERIERLNGKINAVVTVDAANARARADLLDAATLRGEPLGPLHGLPMTVKDSFETKGVRSTGGARELAHHLPDRDAPAVAALRAAGAIIFGKTNLPTWSDDSQTKNDLFGRTSNPWALDRTPGGSSGGSAAAVAAGLTGAELGADTGGSVRIPASHSGVCGHKPSAEVVSTVGNLVFLGSQHAGRDVEAVGPIARTAADLALLLDVLAAPDAHPHAPTRVLAPERPVDLRGRRFAIWFDEPGHPIDDSVRSVLSSIVDALQSAGASVDLGARPDVGLDEGCHLAIELAGAALAFSVPEAPAEPSQDPLENAMWMSHRHWLSLDAERRRMQQVWHDFCGRYDAVLCPVSSTAATPHDGETTGTRLVDVNGGAVPETVGTAWSVFSSGLGIPATVVPAGLTTSGLPVGVMLMGRYLDDRTLLRLAGQLQEIAGGYRPPPDFE